MYRKLFVLISMIIALLPPTHAAAQDAISDNSENDYARSGAYVIPRMALGFVDSGIFDAISEDLRELEGKYWDLPRAESKPPLSSGVYNYSEIDALEFGDINTLLGVSFAGGYRFHPNFAFEGSFDWMKGQIPIAFTYRPPKANGDFLQPIDIETEKIGNYTAWAVAANAKVFLLTGRVQPYALAGLSVIGIRYKYNSEGLFKDDVTLLSEGVQPLIGPPFPNRHSKTAFAPRIGAGIDLYASRNVALNLEVGYQIGVGGLHNENLVNFLFGALYRF